MTIQTKVCAMCKLEKSTTDFNILKRMKDGLNIYCRDCQFLYNQKYREKNKLKLKEYRSTPEYKKMKKECRARHREEIAAYNKKYNLKNKELLAKKYKPYRDNYYKEHREAIRDKSRIRLREKQHNYCIDNSKIENYDKALADNFVGWQRHHRLETHNSDGERRLVQITPEELQAFNMYYNRPAEELIWLTISEHFKIHHDKKKQGELF